MHAVVVLGIRARVADKGLNSMALIIVSVGARVRMRSSARLYGYVAGIVFQG